MRLIAQAAGSVVSVALALGCHGPVCTPRAAAPSEPKPASLANEPDAGAAPVPPAALAHYPFRDPDLPAEARLDNLIAALTLDEKIACLGTHPNVPRLGIRGSDHVEGLHGLALGGPGRWGGENPVTTTTFPQSIGLAQSWDAQLLHDVAALEAREARYAFHALGRGGLVIRAPNADLGRDPRWGRTEECYGEDPHLTSRLVTAFVRGLEGDDPHYFQTASLLKHFLANSNENSRDKTSSNFDERLFYEYYSAGFRRAIQVGGARAFMAAYNLYNDVPCTIHPVLKAVAIGAWGQDGIICTDAGALGNLVRSQDVFPDFPHAAAAAVRAGISQFLDRFQGPVKDAVAQGLLDERDVDWAVRRNFRVMLRLGLLDPEARVPYAAVDTRAPPWESAAARELVRKATRESIVLLKNQNGLLPLAPQRLRSLLVVGRRAREVLLDWYSGTPPYSVTPLDGIRARLSPRVAVEFAENADAADFSRRARTADAVIVCVGNHPTGDAPWAQVKLPSYGREAVDRASIELEDEALVERVQRENPRTILVLEASFPYAINWSEAHVPAILMLSHASQEQGNALADVLFGDFSPAGRLAQTWPRSIQDLPPMQDYDIRHGRTYLYSNQRPLYAFGYGLSYTHFRYSRLASHQKSVAAGDTLTLSVDVENVGTRAGDEVVELYVRRPQSAIARPLQELKAFARVTLAPRAKKSVEFSLGADELAHWDVASQRFVVEPGPLEVRVGGSSDAIAASTDVTLVAPAARGAPE